MIQAYKNDKTLALAKANGFHSVVLPKKIVNTLGYTIKNFINYKQQNTVERYFLKLKCYRKVFTRYDKLYSIFTTVSFVFIFDLIFM